MQRFFLSIYIVVAVAACGGGEIPGSFKNFDDFIIETYGEVIWDEESNPVHFILYCSARFNRNPELSRCPGTIDTSPFLNKVSTALIELWRGSPGSLRGILADAKSKAAYQKWVMAIQLEMSSTLGDQAALGDQLRKYVIDYDRTRKAAWEFYRQMHLVSMCDWDALANPMDWRRNQDPVSRLISFSAQAGNFYIKGEAGGLSKILDEGRPDYGELFEFRLMEADLIFLSEGEIERDEARHALFDDFMNHHVMRHGRLLDRLFLAEEANESNEAQAEMIDQYIRQYGNDVLSVLRIALELAHYQSEGQFEMVADYLSGRSPGLEEFVLMEVVRAYQTMYAGDAEEALRLLGEAANRSPMSRDVNLATIRVSEKLKLKGPWERSVLAMMDCAPFEVESLIFLRRFLNENTSSSATEWLEHVRQYKSLYSPLIQKLLE